MPLRFDKASALLTPAGDYLIRFRQRGRALPLPHLNLIFYALKDCLCLCSSSQALLPLHGEGDLPFILTESCHYPAGDAHLAALAADALAKLEPDGIAEVEEAAPFYPPGSENFWHWTMESLPKLLAMESIGYTGSYIVPTHNPVVRESLAMFSLAPERLLPAQGAYRVRRLMLPPRLSGFNLPLYLPLVELTRERLLAAAGTLPGGKRCFVRRIGRRRPVNETEVLALLKEFGFEVMTPEDMPQAGQWRYMTNVECSVMPHGANGALTLLQKPESGFVEFFSNRYVSYNHLHAVRLLRLKYWPMTQDLDASCATPGMGLAEFLSGGFSAGMEVDLLHLRIALESLLAEK